MASDKSLLFTEAWEHLTVLVSAAIHRNALVFDGKVFDGNYRNFRWGNDNALYHYYEFCEHYGSRADFEWDRAVPLVHWDESFVIPDFIYDFFLEAANPKESEK